MSNAPKLVPQKGILDIQAYVPGKSSVDGEGTIIKLSSNETPLGPSPLAVEAFRAASSDLARYPDPSAFGLRQAIGRKYGLNPDRIVCGTGSDELLGLLAQAYLGPGDEAIYTEHGFLVYKIAIQTNGATPIVAPETNRRTDVDQILNKVSERTKVVFIANPNNPTGTYLPFDEVQRLRHALPNHVLLVLDGAYAEYVRRNDYEAGLELVATTENTVMTRTFSKIHGLAALRVGWCYCPEAVVDVLNRIRGPFNVTGPALAAAAASIGDSTHLDKALAHNEKWVPLLTEKLEGLGLGVTPSVGNFLLVHFPEGAGMTAADADAYLISKRIIVRRVASYGFENALRVTIGTDDENHAVIAALGTFMGRTAGESGC